MKKMKGIFSLILVLCCLLQFAAPMAMAAPADDAAISVVAYKYNGTGYEPATVTPSGASTVGALKSSDLTVVPEEGKIIERILFVGGTADEAAIIGSIQEGKSDNHWATFDASNGSIIIKSSYVTTDGVLDEEFLKDFDGNVKLVAVVADKPTTPTISFDDGGLGLSSALTALENNKATYAAPASGESVIGITDAAADEAEGTYHTFAGWYFSQLGYRGRMVQPGEKVDIVVDSFFSADWNYNPKYTVTVTAPQNLVMGSTESYESVMSRIAAETTISAEPDVSNLTVEGLSFKIIDAGGGTIGAGPVPEGEYTIRPEVPENVVVKSGEEQLELAGPVSLVAGSMTKTVGTTIVFNDGIADIEAPLVSASVTDNSFTMDKGSTQTVAGLSTEANDEALAEGYKFAGWLVKFTSSGETLTVKAGDSIVIKGEATFTAQWVSAQAYKVAVQAEPKVIAKGAEFPAFESTIYTTPELDPASLSIAGLSYKVKDIEGNEYTSDTVDVGEYYIVIEHPENPVVKYGELPLSIDKIEFNAASLTVSAGAQEAVTVTFKDGLASLEAPLVDKSVKNNKFTETSNKIAHVADMHEDAKAEAKKEGYEFVGWLVEYPELPGAGAKLVLPGKEVILLGDATFTAQYITAITITTKDRTAEYNGEVITANKYSISDADKKKLSAADHRIIDVEMKFDGGTDIVTKKNQPASSSATNIVIRDRYDNDVTELYNITVKPGKVTVTKCDDKVVIKAKDAEKVYDGTALTEGDAVATGLKGEDYLVQVITKGAPVEPKDSCANKVTSYNIMNANGKIVTDCYSNIKLEDGYLEVKPKEATITAPQDEEMVRDGSAYKLKAEDISFEGLLIEHHPETKVQYLLDGKKATPTEVGYYVIDLYDVTIKDDDGNDYTDCYDLTVEDGGLFIKSTATSSVLTITAPSGKWVYDGEPHVSQTMNTADPKQVSGLLDGDKIEFKFSASSTITNAGTKANIIEQVIIKDSSGKAVDPEKYDIKKVPGTLTVTKFPITVTAVSDSKKYDGTALVNKKVEVTELANDDHTISVDYSILDKDGKVVKNGAVNVGEYTKKITDVKIMDGKTDVTANYEITKVDGTLTIEKGTGTATGTDSPQTGDTANIGLWVGLLAVSAVVVAAIVVIVIKKGKNKDQQ